MSATKLFAKSAALVVLGLAAASALAQAPRTPAATVPSWPVITQQDMDRASAAVRLPPSTAAVPQGPRVDALPQPQVRVPIDLQAVARGFAASSGAGPQKKQSEPPLLVFVSFAMPEPSLQRLVSQAERSGAALVLRGLDEGSMQKTVARIQNLIGKRQVGFQIDPQAFERFGVRAVPSFVLAAPGSPLLPCSSGQCFASDQYVLVSGDVSIDYALDAIARQAQRFTGQAKRIIAKLEAK